jgi:predicted DNA-binding protein
MKKPATIRMELELPEAAQQQARHKNRTMTNLIETKLKARIIDTTDKYLSVVGV